MLVHNIRFHVKDGREALLRSLREDDVLDMLEYLIKTCGETDFLIRYPEECCAISPEQERQFVEQINLSDNQAMIGCFIARRLVGTCSITFMNRIKTRHRAVIGISVLKEYWGLGIGTKMMEELIRMAEKQEYVTQMELDFIEGNTRAQRLYEKMGFRITGAHPDAIRLKDGTTRNECQMIRKIGKLT